MSLNVKFETGYLLLMCPQLRLIHTVESKYSFHIFFDFVSFVFHPASSAESISVFEVEIKGATCKHVFKVI